MSFKSMLGKTIIGQKLEDNNETLRLMVKDGPDIKLVVEGDCCSNSWIESLDAPDNLLGTVQLVKEIPMPDLGNIPTSKQESVEEVAYYGLKIETDKGTCVIDFRNKWVLWW